MALLTMRPACTAGVKQRWQSFVMGWVTNIYNLELLRVSESTLSRWSRLHLQLLAPLPDSRRVDVRQAVNRKNIAESLSQHDEKHVASLGYKRSFSYLQKTNKL
jgi:hypothetical protein